LADYFAFSNFGLKIEASRLRMITNIDADTATKLRNGQLSMTIVFVNGERSSVLVS